MTKSRLPVCREREAEVGLKESPIPSRPTCTYEPQALTSINYFGPVSTLLIVPLHGRHHPPGPQGSGSSLVGGCLWSGLVRPPPTAGPAQDSDTTAGRDVKVSP